MKSIWAPWRYEYLSAPAPKRRGCIFCTALRAREDREHLVLLRGERVFAMLNLYPYSNGHVMIAPCAHASDPAEVEPATRSDLMETMVRLQEALRAEYRPHGFNVGINVGLAGGAGVADHFHLHLVPRWVGDTNFMTIAGETRVLGETLGSTWRKLRRRLDGMSGSRPAGVARGSRARRKCRS